MAAAERLGILGGTFDPPHIGHLVAALNTLRAVSLDTVLLVVANVPWQKVGTRALTPAAHRLAMVELAVASTPGLAASDVEIELGGESETARTLEHLHHAEPDRELFLIVGADAAAGLDTWRRPERIKALASLVVVTRAGGSARPPAGWNGQLVEIPRLDVSSSDLRRRVRAGDPIDFLVPAEVAGYIASTGLYR